MLSLLIFYLEIQALRSRSEHVGVLDTRRDVKEANVSVETELVGSVDNVNRQASLVGPHAHVVDLVALVVGEFIRPDGGQQTGVRYTTRADVGLAQAGGVARNAKVAPRSVHWLFRARFRLQVVRVHDLLRVQVENVVVVVLGAQDVLLDDALALILSVVGDARSSLLLLDVVILEISLKEFIN